VVEAHGSGRVTFLIKHRLCTGLADFAIEWVNDHFEEADSLPNCISGVQQTVVFESVF
jgi:hypothetical protein